MAGLGFGMVFVHKGWLHGIELYENLENKWLLLLYCEIRNGQCRISDFYHGEGYFILIVER